MNKIKISAVSYTNTKPFIYGIDHSPALLEQIDLSLDIPSDCAEKLIKNQVDIGLIPVAAIPLVPNAEIVSDYGIGSVGAVNSVFILSDVPVEDIETVLLDPESRTSNNLAKVLLKFHFKKTVQFVSEPSQKTDAIVLIGDRTFSRKHDFPYVVDLGAAWMEFTGLPFLYAAWVANKAIPANFIADFNAAMQKGLDLREELLGHLPEVSGFDTRDYLLHRLDFELTDDKRKALSLFLSYIQQL